MRPAAGLCLGGGHGERMRFKALGSAASRAVGGLGAEDASWPPAGLGSLVWYGQYAFLGSDGHRYEERGNCLQVRVK